MQHVYSTTVTRKPCAVCERRVPLQMLMCGDHWRLVPAEQQLAVYRTLYRVRRGGWSHPMGRDRAVNDYETARAAAIASVRSLIQQAPDAA